MIDFHPLADIFPIIEGKDFDDLVKDIRANGLREPIVLIDRKILDGRNRYRACVAAGLIPGSLDEVTVAQLKFFRHYLPAGAAAPPQEELLSFVLSKNLHRRHLDESQRSAIAATFPGVGHGGDRSKPSIEGLSLEQRAKMFHVGRASVERAELVKERAPEIFEAVKQGQVPVSVAAEIAQQPIERQTEIIRRLPRDADGKLTADVRKALAPVIKEIRLEKQIEKKKRRNRREADLGAKICALPEVKAGLIISDFEWHFKVRSEETGMDRHASNHYITAREASTPEAIVERQRERMSVAADDCVHLMWVPACFSAIGHKVMELQGFTYVSQFTWIKPSIGTGFWVRDRHELLFIGVRGNIPCPAMGDQFESAIEAPKGAHSKKPDFQYAIAEYYFPSLPKVELNARRPRKDWIQWGNEIAEPLIVVPVQNDIPTGPADDYPELPDFLKRDPAGIAPFMKRE